MWGAASLQRSDDHIRMTVLVDALPLGAQRFIDILGDLVVLAVLGVITWYGWITAWQLRLMSTVSLGIPVSAFALAVSVCGTLMVVHTLRNLVHRIHGRKPRHAEDQLMDA
jgi:TRAP-type C4-dicarboxylate transport system permease small subunit